MLLFFGLILTPAALGAQVSDDPGTSLEGLPVRTITVHGLRTMEEDVVRRRMDLHVEGRWLMETARRDERAITGLMIFWSVRIEAIGFPQDVPPVAVDVHLHLDEHIGWFLVPQLYWTPEESWSYGLAAGHFNLARRGHWLYLSAVTGGARFISASVSNSWNGRHHESFSMGGSAVSINNRLLDFDEGGERFHYRFGRWFGRGVRAEAAFEYRLVEGLMPSWTDITVAGTPFQNRMMLSRITLGIDTSDPWAFPRVGRRASITIEQSVEALGGTLTGGRARGVVSNSIMLDEQFVIAGYGLIESQWGDIPFWRLLSLGGMNSVRGYDLGTWLVNRRWEASGEFRWYIIPMRVIDTGFLGDQIVGISLALFADAGAGSGIRRGAGVPMGLTPTLRSIGAGIYLHNALLGTLRMEVAWPDGARRHWGFGLGLKF
ncbi:BamA/TamA family outer membrane protein [Gemmatimonadota bacterium]